MEVTKLEIFEYVTSNRVISRREVAKHFGAKVPSDEYKEINTILYDLQRENWLKIHNAPLFDFDDLFITAKGIVAERELVKYREAKKNLEGLV